jgi:hypothetical protein
MEKKQGKIIDKIKIIVYATVMCLFQPFRMAERVIKNSIVVDANGLQLNGVEKMLEMEEGNPNSSPMIIAS